MIDNVKRIEKLRESEYQELFGVKKVLCRIYDPLRRDVYAMLGLEAISPTSVVANLFKESLESE